MNDYKAEFITQVDELIAANIEDRTERMAAVKALTDRYIDAHGTTPDAAQLERLTDYILREELTDSRPDKMTLEEYPIMSERQEERRRDNEYSLDLAESYDLDGVNRAKPERRHRTAREHRFVDKLAQTKNRRRKAQYKRDTSPGPVESYNLRDTGGALADEFVNSLEIGYAAVPEYY
ncbi:hypothetical protein [Paenibacillus chibensis]|uniref:hypothetical protein n=1 Tax=Paenibacillus chibensis TaxID=59846 RepID=UPI000FD98D8A|nr:hypothetical protein [Paenibacillus chibensis]MEC0370029.1 hypothetical protein [Paenibacillus chibensis]